MIKIERTVKMLGNVLELNVNNQNVLDSDVISLKVNSTNINTVKYNQKAQEMVILFNRGTTYLYKDVDMKTMIDLVSLALTGGSVGRFFHQHIKQHECYKKVQRILEGV